MLWQICKSGGENDKTQINMSGNNIEIDWRLSESASES